MPRRLALLVTCALLGLVGAVPSYATARTGGCATVHDARGDAQAPPAAAFRPPATAGVDIHSVSLRSEGDRLVGAITVGDITQQPATSISTRMAYDFVLDGWAFTVFYDVSAIPGDVAGQLYYTQGISVFDEIVSSNLQASITGNTVTLAVSFAELEKIRGKQIRGKRLTYLSAAADANYGPRNATLYPHQNFDVVHAPPSVAPVLGAACR
jgi:hypothetical protein